MASGQTLLPKGPRSRPLMGDENQPLKPKSRRPRAQVALMVSSAEATTTDAVGSLSSGGRRFSTGDSSRLRTARPSPGWRTNSCTLARQQQFTFPRMARGCLLRTAGGCPSPPECWRKKWVADPRGSRPRLGTPSSARTMNVLEAEEKGEATARLASPHHKASGHPYG
jgi:hypothetical protein